MCIQMIPQHAAASSAISTMPAHDLEAVKDYSRLLAVNGELRHALLLTRMLTGQMGHIRRNSQKRKDSRRGSDTCVDSFGQHPRRQIQGVQNNDRAMLTELAILTLSNYTCARLCESNSMGADCSSGCMRSTENGQREGAGVLYWINRGFGGKAAAGQLT